MSHFVVHVALSFLISLDILALTPADGATRPTLSTSDQQSDNAGCAQSVKPGHALISTARLEEPRKAKQSYEKAERAWLLGSRDEAKRKLRKALKIDPEFPEALMFYGLIEAGHQDWISAEDSLNAAIQSDPCYASAYVILAAVYNSQERFDEALDAAKRALSLGDRTWHARYEISRALIGKQEYESALAAIDAPPSPRDGGCLPLVRAVALLGLRRYKDAATELILYPSNRACEDGSQNARHLLQQTFSLMTRSRGDAK
jgi:tetratricopeptide (TPR) repeat protein